MVSSSTLKIEPIFLILYVIFINYQADRNAEQGRSLYPNNPPPPYAWKNKYNTYKRERSLYGFYAP
jgi:hypothetical protein